MTATPEAPPPAEQVADKPAADAEGEVKPVDSAAADSDPATAPAAAAVASPAIDAPAPAPAPQVTSPEPAPEPIAPPAMEPQAAPREREMVQDPRLAVLRAMFPDFDDSLLQSVLDSVNGNTDLAIDALLGMSDPEYTSEQVAAPQDQAPQTQEALDEQLARSLMLEDQREEHAWRAQQQPQQQQQRPQAQRLGSDGAPERDTMQDFQEQFNKLAESGKKTLGSLFSKVKAKIQEFDQPPTGQSSSGAGYGAGGDTYPYEAQQHPYPVAQQQQQRQQAQAQAQMPAYYDPNAPSSNASPPSSATATGYDAAPRSMSPSAAAGAPASPPSTNAGAPQIDSSKLGMLPKRPVSLLRTNSPPSAPHPGSRSDEDELEYAENPFEEGKK